jgi:hypothetical protein
MKEFMVSVMNGEIATIVKAPNVDRAKEKAILFFDEVCLMKLDKDDLDVIVFWDGDVRRKRMQWHSKPRSKQPASE